MIMVMIPTYNESENIAKLIHAIFALPLENLHIVVVDDNSPDKTWEIVKQLQQLHPNLHLLHRTENKGRGKAGIEGFKYALQKNADIIIEMDADFSHDPKYIPQLVEKLSMADMVLGSRRVNGGQDIGRGAIRRFITWGANTYIQIMLGVKTKDCNSGFRAFKRKVLEDIHLENFMSVGPSVVQEVLFKAHLKNFKIAEVPITFTEREEGTSKLGLKQLWQGYTFILKLKWLQLLGKL